jgi:serine/threonine protein kinase
MRNFAMKELAADKPETAQHATVCIHCDHVHPAEELCQTINEHSLARREDDSLIGQTLGEKYRIEEEIGAGGMCLVYRATQTLIGKTVALKVLRPQLAVDQDIVRRFEQEATALGRLHHPHAINVFDFGFTPQGSPYLVMDFIGGQTLTEILRQEGPLPVARANKLLGQVCGALQAAHAEGIIHRDIKPDNILVSEADGEDWVTVVDFGVAKIQEDINQKSALTGAGIIIGTPRYMSPEQSEGRTIDLRSDIYSLGVVLYEMLAGEAPFNDDSSTRLLIKHLTELPPPLRERWPEIPAEIEAVVMRALAKDPDERPASALELSEAFEQAVPVLPYEVPRISAKKVVVPLGGAPGKNVYSESEEITMLRSPSHAQIARSATSRVSNWFSRWPARALAVLALVLVLGLGISYSKRRTEADRSLDNVAGAQRAIALAIGQINQLPQAHLLREQLPALAQWQKELGDYAATGDLPPAAQERVQTMERLAQQYAEQARLAAQRPTISGEGKDHLAGNEEQSEAAKNSNKHRAGKGHGKVKEPAKGPNKFTRVLRKIIPLP